MDQSPTCKPSDSIRIQREKLNRELLALKQKIKEGKEMIVKVGLEIQSLLQKIDHANQVIIRINKVVEDSQVEIQRKTTESQRLKAEEADQLMAEVQSEMKLLQPPNKKACKEAHGEAGSLEKHKYVGKPEFHVSSGHNLSSDVEQTADGDGKQSDDGIKRKLKDDCEVNEDAVWTSSVKRLKPDV